jgi:hypothetical protein
MGVDMSESNVPLKTPSELLAEKIVGVLAENNLILGGDIQKIVPNLANGKLKAEDWRMAIEKAIDKEASDE